jgi:hypothetical protein
MVGQGVHLTHPKEATMTKNVVELSSVPRALLLLLTKELWAGYEHIGNLLKQEARPAQRDRLEIAILRFAALRIFRDQILDYDELEKTGFEADVRRHNLINTIEGRMKLQNESHALSQRLIRELEDFLRRLKHK